MSFSFSIKTLGCKANQYEAAVMAASLEGEGCVSVRFGDKADIVIINTCTVTDNSDRKCRNYIRQGARFSSTGRVVVSGCLSRRAPSVITAMDEVAGIIDTSDRANLAARIISAAGFEPGIQKSAFDESSTKPLEHTRAFLRIQDGCDGSCSYCIVPSVRGLPRSRPLDGIISHAQSLISAGVNEIVLTGITIGSYSYGGKDIADCAKELCSLDGDFRLRITSIEPRHCTDKLLSEYSSQKKICPHIHLPLQSGSDSVLKRMNRPYDTAFFRDKAQSFRAAVPGGAVGTDVIVGFPAESGGEFDQCLEFCNEMNFAFIHQFGFSRRSGTAAAGMPLCGSAEVDERSRRLRNAGHKMNERFSASFIGKSVIAAAERGGWALTPHYLKVYTGPFSGVKGLGMLKIDSMKEGVLQGHFSE